MKSKEEILEYWNESFIGTRVTCHDWISFDKLDEEVKECIYAAMEEYGNQRWQDGYGTALAEEVIKESSQPCEGREVYIEKFTQKMEFPVKDGYYNTTDTNGMLASTLFSNGHWYSRTGHPVASWLSRTTLPVQGEKTKDEIIQIVNPDHNPTLWTDKMVKEAMGMWAMYVTSSPLPPIAEEKVSEGEALTEQQWCKLHTGYYGEEIDRVEQLVQTRMTGRELFEYCQHIVRHFKALSSLPPASIEQEKWVSVEDGLPEGYNKFGDSIDCLVYDSVLGSTGTAWYNHKDMCWKLLHHSTTSNSIAVTHWQPLPTPPIEQR